MTAQASLAPPRHDVYVIALVGFAHGVSHFFHLLLPPLFPWLMPEFGLDFVGIGSTMTLFFVVSGVGQAVSGLAVDRFGPVRVLAAGITCFIAAGLLLSQAASVAGLMLVAALAGLGNSVFHPCDFTILNRNVSTPRLGHAFSVHGLSGNLGWALAPIFMTGVAAHSGWRVAALGAGLLAVPALLLIVLGRRHLVDESRHSAPAGRPVSTLEILKVGPVWMCFAFFFLLTMAFGAFQNFGAPLMQGLYDMSVAGAAATLSTYLLGGAAGILAGGFLARSARQERVIACALGAAALVVLLLGSGWVPAAAVVGLMAFIGFLTGLAGPSRDLLVRRAATARFGQAAFGRVYGFVYSGLDTGLALAPLVFGGLMDRGRFAAVLIGIAVLQVLAIGTAMRVERG
ncbi:MFS transporter [Zoogloea sp.]|uniref:MFS transporter n=1 Tax=Zoogloea sp. TaxID=49181 RepID=UPI0035B43078